MNSDSNTTESTAPSDEMPVITDRVDNGSDNIAGLDLDLRYGFKLAELGFLLPENAPSQVLAGAKIFAIPNTISWLKGLVSVLGSFASVFDLAEMFDLPVEGKQDSVVALTLGEDLVAFPFDSAHSLELPATAIDVNLDLPEAMRMFVGNIYQTDQGLWFEFDFKACLSQYSSLIRQ